MIRSSAAIYNLLCKNMPGRFFSLHLRPPPPSFIVVAKTWIVPAYCGLIYVAAVLARGHIHVLIVLSED